MKPDTPFSRDLEADLKLAAEATPGPWLSGRAGSCNLVTYDGDDVRGLAQFHADRDLRFAILARTGWPETTEELKRLRTVLNRIAYGDYDNAHDPKAASRLASQALGMTEGKFTLQGGVKP